MNKFKEYLEGDGGIDMERADFYERIEKLEEAADKIFDAQELIKEAVDGTGRLAKECEYYILGHLNNWAHETNDSTSIPNIIQTLEDDYKSERP